MGRTGSWTLPSAVQRVREVLYVVHVLTAGRAHGGPADDHACAPGIGRLVGALECDLHRRGSPVLCGGLDAENAGPLTCRDPAQHSVRGATRDIRTRLRGGSTLRRSRRRASISGRSARAANQAAGMPSILSVSRSPARGSGLRWSRRRARWHGPDDVPAVIDEEDRHRRAVRNSEGIGDAADLPVDRDRRRRACLSPTAAAMPPSMTGRTGAQRRPRIGTSQKANRFATSAPRTMEPRNRSWAAGLGGML